MKKRAPKKQVSKSRKGRPSPVTSTPLVSTDQVNDLMLNELATKYKEFKATADSCLAALASTHQNRADNLKLHVESGKTAKEALEIEEKKLQNLRSQFDTFQPFVMNLAAAIAQRMKELGLPPPQFSL